MRVALLAWDYPPAPSGLSTAAQEIAMSLVAAGAEVTVFTLDRTGREHQDGVAIVGCAIAPASRLGRLRLYGGAGHLAAPAAFRRAVLAEHRRAPFDLVEATNWYAPAGLLSGRAPLAVVTRHSTPAAFSRDPARTLRDRFDGWAADRLERRQARHSAGLISNTEDHGRRIFAEYGLAEGAVPHAVIGLSLPPERMARGSRAPYPAEASPLRLLFVGRAEHRKGFDTILAAAALLAAERAAGAVPDFEIRLVGVPPGDLPAGASPLLRPLGRIGAEALEAEYAAAHAVLAPSRYESFGLVYQEGMAYGRPMIASAEDASARHFIGATGAGRLAARNDDAALADAIRPILRDPALRAGLRDRALAAAGRFSRATLGAETLALYAAAIAGFQAR
ncbi:hypothetical protein GCM10011390_47770 [Aureimonas endophytica]|uniref:Glycosyltransferase involved in cell wall biosynthesis n=1 Tax=Aureimonas endophytica TaxID=2027858 RepID=A0A917A2I4_9HYPH|nr:glycosyltransferase family 4 protein [Aureimonas endophytica]GGE22803.1 hypothetical protein GCM10011390_47770 [Aureimonas endophytica]